MAGNECDKKCHCDGCSCQGKDMLVVLGKIKKAIGKAKKGTGISMIIMAFMEIIVPLLLELARRDREIRGLREGMRRLKEKKK